MATSLGAPEHLMIFLRINVDVEHIGQTGEDPALGQGIAAVDHEHPVHGHADKCASISLGHDGVDQSVNVRLAKYVADEEDNKDHGKEQFFNELMPFFIHFWLVCLFRRTLSSGGIGLGMFHSFCHSDFSWHLIGI